MQEYHFDYGEYKKKIAPKNFSGISFCLCVFVCIILMGAALILKPKARHNSCAFYFVEINSFLNYNDANALAIEIKNQNGAGYIYFDGKYHVLASLYLVENDAESVCNNLKADYPTTKIYTLEYNNNFNLKQFNDNQKTALKNMIKAGSNCVEQIYNNILAFDRAEIDTTQLKLNFKKIETDFVNCQSDFSQAFSADDKSNKAKKYLLETNSALQNLASQKENCNMKYELIKFAVNFINVLSCFY